MWRRIVMAKRLDCLHNRPKRTTVTTKAIFTVAPFAFLLVVATVYMNLSSLGKGSGEIGKYYVCQTFNGRLANHIYQYASVFGIAALNNRTVILSAEDDITRYFEVPSAEVRKSRDICQTFYKVEAPKCCTFEPNLMRLPPQRNFLLGVYLQSWRYFGHVINDVRRELTLRQPIQGDAVYITDNIRKAYSVKYSQEPVLVGVHIRRGDIATEKFIHDDGVIVAPDGYLHRAVDYFLDRYPHVIFVICSDGMEYAKSVMNYRNITRHFIHVSPIHDFAVLTTCDHVIKTVGSFGWWAGFLSNGTVVYYKYPMREGSHSRTEYVYSDYFLPGWIGLE